MGVDADIQKEYSRQREHLERSVASLRKKLAKDTEIHRADNVRIMQVQCVMKFYAVKNKTIYFKNILELVHILHVL